MMACASVRIARPICSPARRFRIGPGYMGRPPMRYSGGLLGGTWLTALAGTLETASSTAQPMPFESMHPAILLEEAYHIYQTSTSNRRFLEFEKWWGCPVLMNPRKCSTSPTIFFIANKLSTGQLDIGRDAHRFTQHQLAIVVFCLGATTSRRHAGTRLDLDLYDHDDEIIANGQTIVYRRIRRLATWHLRLGTMATKEMRTVQ